MNTLSEKQLDELSSIVRVGMSEASRSLTIWLQRDVHVATEEVKQVSLDIVTELLGPGDMAICACWMHISGAINGKLLFGFDDASGLKLCDALLSRSMKSVEWGELEKSAAMETTNIIGCAFLNAIAQVFPKVPDDQLRQKDATWIPTPPIFVRDFAASIMQFAMVDQVSESDRVLVVEIQFTIDITPVNWRLLLIPDAESLKQLVGIPYE
jgi:chemotaxis protein CheC